LVERNSVVAVNMRSVGDGENEQAIVSSRNSDESIFELIYSLFCKQDHFGAMEKRVLMWSTLLDKQIHGKTNECAHRYTG